MQTAHGFLKAVGRSLSQNSSRSTPVLWNSKASIVRSSMMRMFGELLEKPVHHSQTWTPTCRAGVPSPILPAFTNLRWRGLAWTSGSMPPPSSSYWMEREQWAFEPAHKMASKPYLRQMNTFSVLELLRAPDFSYSRVVVNFHGTALACSAATFRITLTATQPPSFRDLAANGSAVSIASSCVVSNTNPKSNSRHGRPRTSASSTPLPQCRLKVSLPRRSQAPGRQPSTFSVEGSANCVQPIWLASFVIHLRSFNRLTATSQRAAPINHPMPSYPSAFTASRSQLHAAASH